jgi:ABC-type multidrug transport system fused ATPase/permease subunit
MMSIVDEVLVFDEGVIVERGSHENLFADDTLYRSLYEKQQLKRR